MINPYISLILLLLLYTITITVITLCKLFTPVFVGGILLEFRWQQVSKDIFNSCK